MEKPEKKYWWFGKGSKQRREYAAATIYDLLPVNGSLVPWSYLESRAKEREISAVTLNEHLKRLMHEGMVLREVDPSSRPPRVLYRRVIPEKLKALMEPPFSIIGNVETWLDRIAHKEDRKMVEQALEAILKIDLSEYTARLVNAFYEASTKEKGEDALNHLKAFMEYVYVPRILKLGLLCWALKEEADPATNKLLEGYLEEAKRAVDKLQLAIKKEGEGNV